MSFVHSATDGAADLASSPVLLPAFDPICRRGQLPLRLGSPLRAAVVGGEDGGVLCFAIGMGVAGEGRASLSLRAGKYASESARPRQNYF
jgi:hypothetical protein